MKKNKILYFVFLSLLSLWSCEKDDLVSVTVSNIEKVVTSPATEITDNSATLNGSIKIKGTAGIKEYGFFYGTTQTPSQSIPVKQYKKATEISSVSFTADLSDLKDEGKYYFQAYVKDAKNKLIKGSIESFTTSQSPTLTIISAEYKVLDAVSTYKSCYFKGEAQINYNGNNIVSAGFLLVGYYNSTQKLEGEIKDNKIYVEKEYGNMYGSGAQTIYAFIELADERVYFSPSIVLSSGQKYPF